MNLSSYFVNKTSIIENKYKKIVANALEEYKNGKGSSTEHLYYLNIATKNFINGLDKPLFKQCTATSTPIKEHFNIMINNAIDDVDVLLNEIVSIADHANSISNEVLSYINMFNHSTNKIVNDINSVENIVSMLKDENWYVFFDSFTDSEKSLPQSTIESCKIDLNSGYISIGTSVEREYSSSLSMKILEDSNGFPGNTHEVEILNNKINFLGEDEPYINMYNVIDGKDSTWFEYESYKISDEDYIKCNGLGFKYKENVSWVNNDDELRLELYLYFEEVKLCNWFCITPFELQNKNSKTATIDYVIISDGAFNNQTIYMNKMFDEAQIIVFEPQDVKYIKVAFKQLYSYQTSIGHFYSLKIDKNINIFETVTKDNHGRLEGYMPSVELLGMKYDPSLRKCFNPDYPHKKDFTVNPNIIKSNLFTVNHINDAQIHSDVEVINGYRKVISIKNVSISNYIFNEYGLYCSKPYTTNENIVFIELESDDYIPESFKEYCKSEGIEYSPADFIKYELSFDDGNIWYELNPKHRVHYGPCAININSDILPSMRSPRNIRYIDRLLDTNSIMIRITLKRPNGYIYDSPVVYNYKMNVRTEGDVFEDFGITNRK